MRANRNPAERSDRPAIALVFFHAETFRQAGFVDGSDLRLDGFVYRPEKPEGAGARAFRLLLTVSFAGAGLTLLLLLFNRRLQKEVRERMRSEEALRENERRSLAIIEFLPDATFVVDRSHRVIAWNSAMEAMTGIAKQDIPGRGASPMRFPSTASPGRCSST